MLKTLFIPMLAQTQLQRLRAWPSAPRARRAGGSHACVLVLLLVVIVSSPLHVFAQDANTQTNTEATTETDDELAFVLRTAQDVAQNVTDLAKKNLELRRQFERDERELKRGSISAASLERARQAADAARSRHEAIKVRAQARHDALEEAEQAGSELAATVAQLKAAADTAPDALAAVEQQLLTQNELVEALQQLVESLDKLLVESAVRTAVTREYFELLQGRFTYSLDAPSGNERESPQRRALKKTVQKLIDDASRARTRARLLGQKADEDSEQQRRLLEVTARAAEERAELAQMSLRLLRTEAALRNLKSLIRERSVPLSALRTAAASIGTFAERLAQERSSVARLSRVLQGQRTSLSTASGEGARDIEAERAVVQQVVEELQAQQQRIDAMQSTFDETRKQLDDVLAERERTALSERRQLPPDAAGWQRLGRALIGLPGRVGAAVGESLAATWAAIVQAGSVKVAQLLMLVVALVVGFVGVRFAARKIHAAQPDGVLSSPMEVLLAGLTPALLLPALWWTGGRVLDLPFSQLYLVFVLLLVWPAALFVLRMVREALPSDESDGAQWVRLHRELRWVVMIGAVLAALIGISRAVALSPTVMDVLDRVSMLTLVLIAIPALRLRATFVALSKDTERRRVWHRVASFLSGVILITIGACAVAGLFGYVNLAWRIAEHLAWLAVVAVVWLFAWTMVRDGMRSLTRRSRERGEDGEFWVRNVLTPMNNLIGLALLMLAGFVLLRIYGWTAETPGLSWIYLILTQPVFSVGNAQVTVLGLLSTAVVIVTVFWTGSWSKQVSYRWVYGRISDTGVRQSLSTFTQYTVVVFGLMIALKTIGLDLTALTVFAGALGVGIGFGLQNITSNFISGILLLVERPLRATDVVTVDKYEGEVTHIGIRSLSVKTFDNQEVVIPNSAVITKPFINWTRGDDLMRTVLEIGISYDDDPNHAIEVITKVIAGHTAVVEKPAPKVLLWDFLDSSILIRSQFFSHVKGPVGRGDLRSQILLQIWNAFRDERITIPYPQSDVHLHRSRRVDSELDSG